MGPYVQLLSESMGSGESGFELGLSHNIQHKLKVNFLCCLSKHYNTSFHRFRNSSTSDQSFFNGKNNFQVVF